MVDLPTQIFVPQGAEFKAVQRGLQSQETLAITATPIPMGPDAAQTFFHKWYAAQDHRTHPPTAIAIMGLCGSLHPTLNIGDAVVYQSCIDAQQQLGVPEWQCDHQLLMSLQQHLKTAVIPVTAVTTDHMVHRIAEKQTLAQQYNAQVVDMEGAAIFTALKDTDLQIATIRVVSDDLTQELPDLSRAITPAGQLKPIPLAQALLKEPRKGWNLVRGSMQGLKKLEAIAAALATQIPNQARDSSG
jgi:nucleoside phosphorylase